MLSSSSRAAAAGRPLAAVRRASAVASQHKSPLVCRAASARKAARHLQSSVKPKSHAKPAHPTAKAAKTAAPSSGLSGGAARLKRQAGSKARGCAPVPAVKPVKATPKRYVWS